MPRTLERISELLDFWGVGGGGHTPDHPRKSGLTLYGHFDCHSSLWYQQTPTANFTESPALWGSESRLSQDETEDELTEEQLPRLRATHQANKGVVMKIINESEAILENDPTLYTCTMLKEKMQIISKLDKKILVTSKINDTMKEVDDAEFFKMRIMDAIVNISTSITPTLPTTPSQTIVSGSSAQEANSTNNTSIPPSSLSAPHSTHPNLTVPAPQPSKSILPKMVLAKFKEEVTQFHSSWDGLEGTVNSNSDYSYYYSTVVVTGSYITHTLWSRLQLKSLHTEKLNLNTFGESKFKKQSSIDLLITSDYYWSCWGLDFSLSHEQAQVHWHQCSYHVIHFMYSEKGLGKVCMKTRLVGIVSLMVKKKWPLV